jgi:hypothetical protein
MPGVVSGFGGDRISGSPVDEGQLWMKANGNGAHDIEGQSSAPFSLSHFDAVCASSRHRANAAKALARPQFQANVPDRSARPLLRLSDAVRKGLMAEAVPEARSSRFLNG